MADGRTQIPRVSRPFESPMTHPCPLGDNCALNRGAIKCKACGRNWPPDETWQKVHEPERAR